MHGIGSTMFQGIEQTDDSLYSSKENDESDIEPGKFFMNFFFVALFHTVLVNNIFVEMQAKVKNAISRLITNLIFI